MKSSYLFLFFFFTIQIYSQWQVQNPLYFDLNINSCSFIDTLNGWVSGNKGFIAHTSDGGNSWIKQNIQTNANLSKIRFSSPLCGWVVGNGGWIAHTTDGGNNWLFKNRYSSENYLAISPVNDSTVWITGYYDLILFSSNHGNTWEKKSWSGTDALWDCKFFTKNNGWVVTSHYTSTSSSGSIYNTGNGGLTWIKRYNGTSMVRGISFAGNKFGWSVGDPGANLKSTDGGSTWTSIFSNNRWLSSVCFSDSLHGWATELDLSANGYAVLIRTTDGGIGWTGENFGKNINDLCYINSTTGWIVGPGGLILKTTNKGANWIGQSLINYTTQNLNSTFFIDRNIGWAGGNAGTLLKTTNGGARWSINHNSTLDSIKKLFFIDKTTGWAACNQGIFKTTDGGINWLNQSGLSTSGIQFIDSLNGWSSNGNLSQSTDGGTTWLPKFMDSLNSVNAIYFINKNKGFAVGTNGRIFRTLDGGINWDLTEINKQLTYTSIHFYNEMNGFVVNSQNGNVLRTTNGGTNWESYACGGWGFYSVFAIDAQNIWAVGKAIYKSTDGGISWESTGALSTLYSVMFADTSSGWAVGNSGVIMKYGSITNIDNESQVIANFDLYQNYPNPFNPSTTLKYSVPKETFVSIKAYSILGEEVADLVNEIKQQGTYEVVFKTNNLASGIYLFRMTVENSFITRKAILIK